MCLETSKDNLCLGRFLQCLELLWNLKEVSQISKSCAEIKCRVKRALLGENLHNELNDRVEKCEFLIYKERSFSSFFANLLILCRTYRSIPDSPIPFLTIIEG